MRVIGKLRLGFLCLLLAAVFGCGSKDDIPVVKGSQDAPKADSAGTIDGQRHQASQMGK